MITITITINEEKKLSNTREDIIKKENFLNQLKRSGFITEEQENELLIMLAGEVRG